MSFTCAVSTNLNPPNLTKGMFDFVNSISRSNERNDDRNSTAIVLPGDSVHDATRPLILVLTIASVTAGADVIGADENAILGVPT